MKRRVLVAALVVLIGLAAIRLAIRPVHVLGYREIDDYNIAVQVIGASPLWRGVTEQKESASAVAVAVSEINSFQFGAGFGDERIAYVAIRLSDPLAGRPVIDALSGTDIPLIQQ